MATWAAYRQLRGPLNLGMRLEYLFAMSDYRYHLSQQGKLKFEQFVRFHDVADDQAQTAAPDAGGILEVAKLLGAPLEVRERKRRASKAK